MRLYVAKVFFVSGLLKFSPWDSTLALFENEYHVPLLSPYARSGVGDRRRTRVLPCCWPRLLHPRRGARLFVVNIVAVISYPDLSPPASRTMSSGVRCC